MKVRYATAADLEKWYGGPPPMTTRALVVDRDGEILAVAGLCRAPNHVQLFSEIKDELRAHKMTMARTAAMLRSMINGPVMAMQDCSEPTSRRLLEWCGLREIEPGIWSN